MDWVLDASMALAWSLPDESSEKADRFLSRVSAQGILWVPALWWYELSNALVMAQRRRRVTEADRLGLLELYGRLPIHTDSHLSVETVWRLQALAQEHAISVYDAAYLELATRKGLGLATLDQRLVAAARNAGIQHL